MIRKPDRATNCPQLPRVSAGRTLPKRTIHSGRLPPRQTNDNSFGSGISNFPLATQDEIERARIRPAATLSNITHSTTTEQRCANCRGFRPTPTMCELPGFSPRCGDGRVAGVSAILTTLSAGRAGSAERAERPAGTWHRTAFRRGPSGPCRLRLSRAMPRGAGAGWTFAAPLRPPHRTQGFIARGAGIEPAQHSTLRAAAVQRVGPAADQGAFGRRTGGRRGS